LIFRGALNSKEIFNDLIKGVVDGRIFQELFTLKIFHEFFFDGVELFDVSEFFLELGDLSFTSFWTDWFDITAF
jgi:hypothetical protein